MTITDNDMTTDDADEAITDAASAAGAVPDELIDAVMANVDTGGVELLGPDGVLAELTKRILERSLSEELTDHLGYEPGDPAGRGSGNNRNGTTPKTVFTEIGAIDLDIPRPPGPHHLRTSSTASTNPYRYTTTLPRQKATPTAAGRRGGRDLIRQGTQRQRPAPLRPSSIGPPAGLRGTWSLATPAGWRGAPDVRRRVRAALAEG